MTKQTTAYTNSHTAATAAGKKPLPARPLPRTALAVLATLLWGSAFPAIKIGYRLFQINTAFPPNTLVFAGLRFMLAGLLTLAIYRLLWRESISVERLLWPRLLRLGLIQTTLQYICFYIGLIHTSGVKASILGATGSFMIVLLAHFFLHDDRLTSAKTLACLCGLAGVILLHLTPDGFSLLLQFGDLLILGSALAQAFGSLLSRQESRRIPPVLLCGWQLLIGGTCLAALGLILGGRIGLPTPGALALLLYLAALSAVAFSIWNLLLKYNALSSVGIYSTLTPVFGAAGSAFFLGESFFTPTNMASLALIVLGILILQLANERRAKAATRQTT